MSITEQGNPPDYPSSANYYASYKDLSFVFAAFSSKENTGVSIKQVKPILKRISSLLLPCMHLHHH